MSTIREVIASTGYADHDRVLERALIAREDNIADLLRLAGAQFGMYPWIIAEVLAQAGLGTPLSEPEREFIRQQFVEGMEELARQQNED